MYIRMLSCRVQTLQTSKPFHDKYDYVCLIGRREIYPNLILLCSLQTQYLQVWNSTTYICICIYKQKWRSKGVHMIISLSIQTATTYVCIHLNLVLHVEYNKRNDKCMQNIPPQIAILRGILCMYIYTVVYLLTSESLSGLTRQPPRRVSFPPRPALAHI